MDGFQGLNRLGTELKRTVRIQFMNELGVAEAGVDGGGLFKDFLDNLTREAFNPEHGFFKVPICTSYRRARLYKRSDCR